MNSVQLANKVWHWWLEQHKAGYDPTLDETKARAIQEARQDTNYNICMPNAIRRLERRISDYTLALVSGSESLADRYSRCITDDNPDIRSKDALFINTATGFKPVTSNCIGAKYKPR